MKKQGVLYTFLFLLLPFLCASPAHAIPIGNGNYAREYMVGTASLRRWRCGIFTDIHSQRVWTRWHNPNTATFQRSGAMAYVGVDVVRWLHLYAAMGGSSSSIGIAPAVASPKAAGGMHLNLLDHEILDPTLFEDRIRINADILAGASHVDWQGNGSWIFDGYASLTFSFVNDLDGNKAYVPYSLAIYAGPAVSVLYSGNVRGRNPFGATAGLEMFCTERVSLHVGADIFGTSVTPSAGVHVNL